MKNNDKQFAERMIIDSVKSLVSKYPNLDSLEECIKRYTALKDKILDGSLKTERIKLENFLKRIRYFSRSYDSLSKDEIISELFKIGYLQADELIKAEERRHEEKITEIPSEIIKDIIKRYPDIPPERVIVLLKRGLLKAENEIFKKGKFAEEKE